MARTKLERVEVGTPGVAAFRVAGKLGFHENKKIQSLVDECLKRDFKRVVFDFSELSSLGGGVAKILREFVRTFNDKGSKAVFVITKDVVLQFLQDEKTEIEHFDSFEDAVAGKGGTVAKSEPGKGAEAKAADDGDAQGDSAEENETAPDSSRPAEDAEAGRPGVILMSYDGGQSGADDTDDGGEGGAESEQQEGTLDDQSFQRVVLADEVAVETQDGGKRAAEISREADGAEQPTAEARSEAILSEIFEGTTSQQTFPEWIDRPTSPFGEHLKVDSSIEGNEELNKQLRRKVLELKTLFSISTDFNSIRERKKLIDIFLLTSIAQGGVEAAAYFEKVGEKYKHAFSKGLNADNIEKIEISSGIDGELRDRNIVMPLSESSMSKSEKSNLKKEGLEFMCPFRQQNELTGIVLLGKRIAGRGMKEGDFEFLRILVNVAQGAYENALMFEREHERTLGIVKTLISLIEENTLLKGSSEIVSRYVGMLAKKMDYAEEHFKDLIYGTVLRDMGMIKVSDLILRSPRELTKEEWEIIKRHPEDGAEMLRRMKFSDHVVHVVRAHHERFNGEGYPAGLRGKEIPLGARIISVVESYAAMINERPNRPALSDKEALDTLKENYGLRYDREVVTQFAKIMEKEIAKSVRPPEVVIQ
jgi:HD-GYP domain-containing protein (c-di-GMP phosphodiesterase class II)/anti-anti-sigma regulatory factor